jgi:two-component system phosphate regulon sensor histidine kinase PhoR
MTAEIPRTESGIFRAVQPSPEVVELQDMVSRMFLLQDPAEILQLTVQAAKKYTGADEAKAFRCDAPGKFVGADDPLFPEKAVLDYVVAQARPITVPQGKGWITVFPMRTSEGIVGILVLEVTRIAEEVSRMNLEPIALLAGQAAVMLHNALRVSRSIGESTLLHNILDSITNAIVTLDGEQRITRLNRNAMAMFEVTADVIGRTYQEAFQPSVADAIDGLLQDTEQMGFAMEKMITARMQHGPELNIAASMCVLRDESFTPLGQILVFRDMTASRELERLRRLDTMKSEFVANVSHELKTPLTSIKAYTEALLDLTPEGQSRDFLKVIDEESDRLLFLINDLLNVSRIQSGKIKLHLELTPPRAVVDEILSISKVNSEKHALDLDIAPDLPEMLLDKEKMKEVMLNLVSNAIKYSPAGGRVRISMRLVEGNLRIEVQDQGVGIPPEHQAKLFQAFYRVDNSATASIAGTGLGLVIVKAIVEHHGGQVGLVSSPGEGTTFHVLIPVRREIARDEIGRQMGSMAEGA